jgi:SAM-dependent methyltransferase
LGSTVWNAEIAEIYDETSAGMFDDAVLGPTVNFLTSLAGEGPALEFAAGTGRVAGALHERGIEVHGIELSPHMAEKLLAKTEAVPLTIGDMTSTHLDRRFALVYLVFNTIMNVTTQEEQVAVFENAARHLQPGGCFVVEVLVPNLRQYPPGETMRVFTFERDHIGIDTLDDEVGQLTSSHHWMNLGGKLRTSLGRFRYVYPSEMDLMARLAGLKLRERFADWYRSPFTADSASQIAVYEKVD